MGGNGSASKMGYVPISERLYRTVGEIGNVQILQYNNGKQAKLPEESNTPNRFYAVYEKGGTELKELAYYGSNHKRRWVIHAGEHDYNGISPHCHFWRNGKPVSGGYLSPSMKKIWESVIKYKK
jgi:hypothetical protein